jgi:uncharacterized protein (DUF433 family)
LVERGDGRHAVIAAWADGSHRDQPKHHAGQAVIRGTRVPVELLLRKLAEGAVIEDLLDAYPRLAADDIRAALAYAADTIAHETVLALSSP